MALLIMLFKPVATPDICHLVPMLHFKQCMAPSEHWFGAGRSLLLEKTLSESLNSSDDNYWDFTCYGVMVSNTEKILVRTPICTHWEREDSLALGLLFSEAGPPGTRSLGTPTCIWDCFGLL